MKNAGPIFINPKPGECFFLDDGTELCMMPDAADIEINDYVESVNNNDTAVTLDDL